MYRTAGVNPAGSGSSDGLPASPVPDGLARQAEKPCSGRPVRFAVTPRLCLPPFRPTALPPSPLALPLPRFPSPPFSPALAPVSRSRLPLPSPVSPRRPPSPPVVRSPKFSGKRRRRGLTHSFFVLCSFVQNVAACDVGFIDSKKEGTCLVPDIAAM